MLQTIPLFYQLYIGHSTVLKRSLILNSENISRFYLQRARGYLKTGNIKDAVSDLNKSYELGYPVANILHKEEYHY